MQGSFFVLPEIHTQVHFGFVCFHHSGFAIFPHSGFAVFLHSGFECFPLPNSDCLPPVCSCCISPACSYCSPACADCLPGTNLSLCRKHLVFFLPQVNVFAYICNPKANRKILWQRQQLRAFHSVTSSAPSASGLSVQSIC